MVFLLVLCLRNLGLAKGEIVGREWGRGVRGDWKDGSAILGDDAGVCGLGKEAGRE